MSFAKHEPKKTKKPSQLAQPENVKVVVTGPDTGHTSPSMQHDINHITGLADIEESLDWIARGIDRITSEGVSLSTSYDADPIKITLQPNAYDDTLDRLVTAFERIADSVARLAGLTRPRLESWHEQDTYTPRYKDMACDGGAPGPRDKGEKVAP